MYMYIYKLICAISTILNLITSIIVCNALNQEMNIFEIKPQKCIHVHVHILLHVPSKVYGLTVDYFVLFPSFHRLVHIGNG